MVDEARANERTVPSRRTAFGSVVHNRQLSTALRGYSAMAVAEHGAWLTILLYAYDQGGVSDVGWLVLLLLVPPVVLAPLVAAVGDRVRAARLLPLGFTLVATFLGLTAAAMITGAPRWVTYGVAVVASVAVTFARPAISAVVPRVSATVDELTAANVVVGIVETLGTLAGPALAGLILLNASPGVTTAIMAGLGAVGAASTMGRLDDMVDDDIGMIDDPAASIANDLVAGFRLVRHDRQIRALTLSIASTSIIVGALDVGAAVIAIELLGLDQAATGLIVAGFGIGSLAGAAAAYSLVGRRRLGRTLAAGVVAMSLAFGLIGASSTWWLTAPLLVLAGVGVAVTGVVARTMLQGLTPDDTLARLFGLLEAIEALGLAVGGVVLARLAVRFGNVWAFAAIAVAGVVVVAVQWRRLAAIDDARRDVDVELVALARSTAVFRPLPPYVMERFFSDLHREEFGAGDLLMRRGEVGDRVCVVESGTVVVDVGPGTSPIVRGRGSLLGEIALLRRSPRSADVRSGPDGVTVYWMDGPSFVDAVNAVPRSRARAEAEIDRRISRTDPTASE